jgi:small GTP-binding protein
MADNSRLKSPKPGRRTTVNLKPKHSRPANLRLRIVLVGDEQTGKSCLIKRYCEKRFVSKYLATIGIDYGATKIFVDKREVAIHIFDTSGRVCIFQKNSKKFENSKFNIENSTLKIENSTLTIQH